MGRPPKIRTAYSHDAAYLIRLSDAIARDEKSTEEWKTEVCSYLKKAAAMFLTREANRLNG